MKNLAIISIFLMALTAICTMPLMGQFAQPSQLDLRVLGEGLHMVGPNSTDSKVGPYFGASLAYGLGGGVSLYGESGYGWTNFQSNDKLKLTLIPVVGGLTYNFGEILNSSDIQPYAGVGGGLYNYKLQEDGTTIMVGGTEQSISKFGAEGIAGLHLTLPEYHIGLDLRAKYNHVFSNSDGSGLNSQDLNSIGVGAGFSYHLGL